MKNYRLKNEVKKYFGENFKYQVGGLDFFKDNDITIEALEEVNERVEVNFSKYGNINTDNTIYLHKGDYSEWTEQEREDIEKFLNIFKSWENMHNYINRYAEHVRFYTEGKSAFESFGSWLKDIKINETTN